jgi:DNA-binding GntR family transcriptional regulator
MANLRSRTRPLSPEEDGAPAEGWLPLKPRTLVDMVIEALIAGVARGLILPGDRVVETELAQRLGVSRVPVREALRVLESQGLVINEPYKGIRLMPVSQKRIDDLIEARVALETTAAIRAIREGRHGEREIAILARCIEELEVTSEQNDAYGFANADTAFHRALCGFSGNDVLCGLWEGLARQATIFFGLSALIKPMAEIIEEHRVLMAVFRTGDVEATTLALKEHIDEQTHRVDFESIVAQRRAARSLSAEAAQR